MSEREASPRERVGPKSTKDDAATRALPPKGPLRDYLETIVVCVLFLIFARTFVFMQSKIPTESMLDTLLVGDYILVNRSLFGAASDRPVSWLGQRPIARQDVIVFRYPEDPDVDFVKRVIGLPGDTVEIIAGDVFVDGARLEEPYVSVENRDQASFFGPLTVPDGSYFVLGDNRTNSRDSRYWGPVERSLIKGRAFFIWFSYEEDKNDHLRTGAKRLYSIAKKLRYLPTRTRWTRIFSGID
ncbi:MAG: signal peptidase I [Acidobacteriota bacterium]|nr:MAG: signal peptidase I [Acidobacteriota bacterium]